MHNYDKLYDKLMNCNWFEKCGSKETKFEGFDYIWAKNIADVEKNINSTKWENTCIEEMNEISACLSEFQDLLDLWNEQVENTKKNYIPTIINIVKSSAEKYSLPESVCKDVQWNILMCFICDFYSEQYNSEFYNRLLEIYLSGHLPCGYKGRFQKGSIIIY